MQPLEPVILVLVTAIIFLMLGVHLGRQMRPSAPANPARSAMTMLKSLVGVAPKPADPSHGPEDGGKLKDEGSRWQA